MKAISILILFILIGCKESKIEVKREESCSINGKAVSCSLIRGIEQHHTSARPKNKLAVKFQSPVAIDANSFTFLTDVNESNQLDGNVCDVTLPAGLKINFVRLDDDHLELKADAQDSVATKYVRVAQNPDEWETTEEDTDNDISYITKFSLDNNLFKSELTCDFH